MFMMLGAFVSVDTSRGQYDASEHQYLSSTDFVTLDADEALVEIK